MIIESGSSIKVVSQSMGSILKLLIEKHSRPRKIALVNDHSVLVTKRSLVKFKIGSYKDSIWCNVIAMKVTHILIGRPYLID